MHKAQVTGQLVLSGVFECRDKNNQILKTIEIRLPLTDEQAQQLQPEPDNGTDDCE